MTSRAFLAAILGAIAMFIWNWIGHAVLPIGEVGVREIPPANEQALLDAMKTNLTDNGLYHFPGKGLGPNPTRQEKTEAMQRIMEKVATGPSGFLVYHPTRVISFGRLLGIEFATELLQAILVVFLLVQAKIENFGCRVGFVFVAGILAVITTNISYWNWYGFSKRYTAAYMFIEIVGFLCLALVAALVLKKNTAAAAAAP